MGIKGAHSLTYTICGISIQQLYSIANYLCNTYNRHRQNKKQTIYADASWLMRRCYGGTDSPILYFLRLSCVFASCGFRFIVVCDGPIRHHSKRSTIKRYAESYSNRVHLSNNNASLMNLISERNATNSVTERERLDSLIQDLSSKTKTLQNKANAGFVDVGQAAFQNIKEEIEKLTEYKDLISVLQSEFQADSTLASLINTGDADIILSADSDLAALLGSRCVAIKKFKFGTRSKDHNIKDIEIFSPDISTIKQIADHINLPLIDTPNFITAKKPVFDGLENMRLRCLIAIGLGCDIFLSGVPSITPKTIYDIIQSFRQKMITDESLYYEAIMKKYLHSYVLYQKKKDRNNLHNISEIEQNKYKEMLEAYIDFMMYEPSNFLLGDENAVENRYNANIYINPNETP
jgi:hypothetical protein